MFKAKLFLILLAAMALITCNKTEHADWSDMYDYFPVEEGHWVSYQVDSVAYNKLLDTVIHYRYQVKKTIGPAFTDLSGEQWQRVDVYARSDSFGVWQISAASAQKRAKRTAETIEDNLRFIKLIYPFRKFTFWQGNSYIHFDDIYNCNFYGDWSYQYKDLYIPQEMRAVAFDSVVVVRQVADSGLICKNLGIEMYAPRIGMIYKHIERLTTQSTSSQPFYLKAEDGYILTYTILDWKKD